MNVLLGIGIGITFVVLLFVLIHLGSKDAEA